MSQPTPALKRVADNLRTLPSPLAFLRAERRTPPRFLSLWIMSLIAVAGYEPGSVFWLFTGIGALVLGVALAPLLGSIRPTATAYVWLLVTILGLTLLTRGLPLGTAYDKAWADADSTGLLAMMLIGGVAVGGFTSIVWGLVVVGEAVRRLALRKRIGPTAVPGKPIPVSVEPVPPRWARMFSTAWRRVFIGLVSIGIAIPLPSYLLLSGVHSATLRGHYTGERGALGGLVHASVWPALTLGWLAVGAAIGWLVWLRTARAWRIAAICVGVAIVVIVLLNAGDFGVVPGASSAQSYGADVLAQCPSGKRPCPPSWLFDAPTLASATYAAAAWCSALLLLAAAAMSISWWARRGGAGRA